LQARRDACDAMIGVISAREVVQLTKMGELDMMKPATGPMRLLKKLQRVPRNLRPIRAKSR
jgi:magnesium chelatase subunit H